MELSTKGMHTKNNYSEKKKIDVCTHKIVVHDLTKSTHAKVTQTEFPIQPNQHCIDLIRVKCEGGNECVSNYYYHC